MVVVTDQLLEEMKALARAARAASVELTAMSKEVQELFDAELISQQGVLEALAVADAAARFAVRPERPEPKLV